MTEAQTVSLMEARDRRSRDVLESVMHSASLQEVNNAPAKVNFFRYLGYHLGNNRPKLLHQCTYFRGELLQQGLSGVDFGHRLASEEATMPCAHVAGVATVARG